MRVEQRRKVGENLRKDAPEHDCARDMVPASARWKSAGVHPGSSSWCLFWAEGVEANFVEEVNHVLQQARSVDDQ